MNWGPAGGVMQNVSVDSTVALCQRAPVPRLHHRSAGALQVVSFPALPTRAPIPHFLSVPLSRAPFARPLPAPPFVPRFRVTFRAPFLRSLPTPPFLSPSLSFSRAPLPVLFPRYLPVPRSSGIKVPPLKRSLPAPPCLLSSAVFCYHRYHGHLLYSDTYRGPSPVATTPSPLSPC